MTILEHRRQAEHVETTGCAPIDTEISAVHLAAERSALKEQESRRALEVGQRVRIDLDQALEFGAARDLPFKHVHERLVVALQDPIERDDVARDIVDDFHFRRRRPLKEDAAHANKGLGIVAVWNALDQRDQALREVSLATDIGRGGTNSSRSLHVMLNPSG